MRHKSEELMQQILNYAEKFLLLNHRSPYTSEIADALGIVKSTVYRYLVEMNERGMLSYHNGVIVTERTEKLSPDTKPAAVLGSVSCGMPQLEEEYVEEYVSLPVSLFGDGEFFILRANGDSMTGAGINSGDMVVIRKQNTASDGDIVVALVENEFMNCKIGQQNPQIQRRYEEGNAVFDLDLPFGKYYIRELAAPAGYVSSDETLDVTAAYQGQDVKVVKLASEFKNQPTKITVKKSDITTGVELSGATLTVLDKDKNVVDTWKSVKGEEHLIERLTVGETYTLREEMAPYGYLKAEEIAFTVEDTAEIQKVEMKDDVPTGTLIINKKGEFLEKVYPVRDEVPEREHQ